MATTKKGFILAAFFASAISVICTLVSLGTQEWVTASPVLEDTNLRDNGEENYVRYGLFKGFMRMNTGLSGSFEFQMTCNFGKNICAQLCEISSDGRAKWLEDASNQSKDISAKCQQLTRHEFYDYLDTPVRREIKFTKERTFINAGIWLCTILFLVLSAVVGAASAGLAAWNTLSNPIEVYFGIFGLYLYNSIAWCFCIMSLCLWGIHYTATLFYDIAIEYTITGDFTSEKKSSLGYSYWINMVPLILYPASIALLFTRDYLNAKDPGQKNIHLEESADPAIYLY